MGEQIYVTLTMLDNNLPETWQRNVASDIAAVSGYSRDQFELDTGEQTITSTEEIKWYSFAEDMETLSKSYTALRMELLVKHLYGGETLVYAYQGKTQIEPGRIEFGPCTLWTDA